LALLLRDLGRRQGARELWERSLVIVENAFGPNHPKVALRLSNLADLLQDSGDVAAAERHYQRLLKLREAGSVVKKREVKSSLRRYAKLLRSARRKEDARKVEAQIITGGPGWFSKWK
jgi:tetratricopeptide (TPR) repeat protein